LQAKDFRETDVHASHERLEPNSENACEDNQNAQADRQYDHTEDDGEEPIMGSGSPAQNRSAQIGKTLTRTATTVQTTKTITVFPRLHGQGDTPWGRKPTKTSE
jgi:hypothetical protein